MTKRDWTQPVLDLLEQLQAQELELLAVDDGEGFIGLADGTAHDQQLAAADAITSVDMAWLAIGADKVTAHLCIVLGNEPDELVADWLAPPLLEPLIQLAIDQHRLLWEGKACPVIDDHTLPLEHRGAKPND